MQRAVGNEYALILRLILAPCVIKTDVVAQVLREHRTMKRTNLLDVQGGYLLEEVLHHRTILAYDVEVVAASLASPVVSLVHQRAKLTKAVSAEQHLIGSVVTHDDLWPVHHRSHEELQGVLT